MTHTLDETIGTEEFKQHLRACLDEVHDTPQRLTITRRGIPIAAVVPLTDLKRLKRLELANSAEEVQLLLDDLGDTP